MTRLSTFLTIVSLSALLTGCFGDDADDAFVPKPIAYPRIDLYPDSAVTDTIDGVSFKVNASAILDRSGYNSADIYYPRYEAILYLAVNKNIPDLAAAEDGRRMRMSLNLSGSPAIQSTSVHGADSAVIVTAQTAIQTPVQFMLVNRRYNAMVTGAFFMNGWTDTTPYDSIRPVIDALNGECRRLVSSIVFH